MVTPATLRLAAGARSSTGDLGPPRALTEMDKTIPTREPKRRKKGGDDDKSKHDGHINGPTTERVWRFVKSGMEGSVGVPWSSCGQGLSAASVTRGEGSGEGTRHHCTRTYKGAAAEQGSRRSRSRRQRADTEKKRPKSPELPKGGIQSHPSTSAKVKPAPREKPSPVDSETKAPEPSPPKQWQGRRYGTWTHDEASLGERPRCLHLFAGPQRAGDLADCLKKFGWATCSVDILQLYKTDLLDDQVRRSILEDIREGYFDAVFLGTPCETYSALRKERPGPRPLRSKEEITGLSSDYHQRRRRKGGQSTYRVFLSGDEGML